MILLVYIGSDIRDDLCKTIIADMNEYGLSVIDDFLGRAKGLDILSEVDNMYGAGVFRVCRISINILIDSKYYYNIYFGKGHEFALSIYGVPR